METLDAIEKRWGCRKYKDEPVDKEVLGTILDAGRLAPSAGNLQDRSFIVVKDQNLKSEIAKACGNQLWMQAAPVHVVVLAENKKNPKFFGTKGEKIYSIQDTAFSVQNMLLAATDLGLGCSLVVGFNEEKISDLLEVQDPMRPYAVVVLGYPAETPKPSSKYPLERFVFFEKYGNKIEEFGDLSRVRERIAEKSKQKAEEAKKTAFNLFDKIKSLFKRKKEDVPMEDHFMEPEMPKEPMRK
jgi:nitroreductase